MENERERMLRNAKRKKILLIGIGVIIAIFAILGIIALILAGINSWMREQSKAKLEDDIRPPSYIFAEPNYNENIFDDAVYMTLDREIYYTSGQMRTSITENNYASQLPAAQFMYDIILYIINGDYENYNKIFTDFYIKQAGDALRETFTMQKLYNIDIEILLTWDDVPEAGKRVIYSDFKVSYMIKNNNGTFRNDIPPEEARVPVVYRVMTIYDSREDIYESFVYDLLHIFKYESGLYN